MAAAEIDQSGLWLLEFNPDQYGPAAWLHGSGITLTDQVLDLRPGEVHKVLIAPRQYMLVLLWGVDEILRTLRRPVALRDVGVPVFERELLLVDWRALTRGMYRMRHGCL